MTLPYATQESIAYWHTRFWRRTGRVTSVQERVVREIRMLDAAGAGNGINHRALNIRWRVTIAGSICRGEKDVTLRMAPAGRAVTDRHYSLNLIRVEVIVRSRRVTPRRR